VKSKTKEPPQTWTPEQVARQERALEARVSEAQRELDRVKKWHQAELRELRKFRKAKVTHAAQIVPSPAVTSRDRA
jgi:adenylosuccinate lyase